MMPIALKRSSAMVVNLSLLTADFFTLLVGLFVFNYKVKDLSQISKTAHFIIFSPIHCLIFLTVGDWEEFPAISHALFI